jgi:isopenicillin N synthase-like dioxygenase
MTGVIPWDEMSIVQSHGIPEEVIDNAVKAGKKYFSLPEAAKMEVSFYYVSSLDCLIKL